VEPQALAARSSTTSRSQTTLLTRKQPNYSVICPRCSRSSRSAVSDAQHRALASRLPSAPPHGKIADLQLRKRKFRHDSDTPVSTAYTYRNRSPFCQQDALLGTIRVAQQSDDRVTKLFSAITAITRHF